ncbi:MAG: HEPN domain-containing protein, partial [Candidatus Poribacteria bacterium]|nr:HEPN domain-containing protein [Candidatus Poribacteria bacterium]
IPHRFSLDLLVRSPEEIASRVSYNDWFLREITEKGDFLYGSDADYTIGNRRGTSNTVKKEQDRMNLLTLEWIEKAEEDYDMAALARQASRPFHNSICFHAQQCIEKYLKAWLQETDVPVPRTHDLEELLVLIVPTLPDWSQWQPDFKRITEYAVNSRYPGDSATAEDTEHAMRICDAVRQAVRASLKLSTDSVK